MSKRLQVILDSSEFSIIKKASVREKKSISEWVRGIIRMHLNRYQSGEKKDLIKSLRGFRLPAPPIEQMLEEIEKGRS